MLSNRQPIRSFRLTVRPPDLQLELWIRGEPPHRAERAFLRSEIQRLVTEALLADDRITAVENFKINITGKRQAAVEFTVVSVFGEMEIETEVTI